MDKYDAILKQQEKKNASRLLAEHQLVCKQLPYGNEAPLYISKSHWTNRFDSNRESTIGIFFSIWVSPELIAQEQFAYNIHAKKIRALPGYKVTARGFADEFRMAVESQIADWPGIRTDYGPLTLLEGRDICSEESFSEKAEERIAGFVSIHNEIDTLLEASAV